VPDEGATLAATMSMASTTYSESSWQGYAPRTERVHHTRGQRSAVTTIAVAVAAIGVIGYLGFVGATAPKLDPALPESPPLIVRMAPLPPMVVRIEQRLALPEPPTTTALEPGE
jgi:hypothetical protein